MLIWDAYIICVDVKSPSDIWGESESFLSAHACGSSDDLIFIGIGDLWFEDVCVFDVE